MARNGKENLPTGTHAQLPTHETVSDALDWQAALIDLSFEPIFAWDWEKGIIEWNAGAEKQYGFTRSEVIGKNPNELLSTKHPISLRRFLKKLETDGYWIGEVRHMAKDGRELIVESRQQVIVQHGRRVVMESNRDITERRAGEGQVALLIIIGDLIRKITNPEELLFAASKAVGRYFHARRCLFNEIDIEKNLEVIHQDYYRGVKSITGNHKLSVYSPITTAEMTAGTTVANEDSKADPRTATFYKKVYGPAGERSYVAIPLMRDGKWKASFWISDDQPRKWSPSEVNLLELIGERVWLAVERKHAEDELRRIAEFDEAVRLNMAEGLYTLDAAGGVTTMNPAAESILGWKFQELRGRNIHNAIHHHYLDGTPYPKEECAAVGVLRDGKPVVRHEDVFIRKDGTFIDVVYSSSPLRNDSGDIVGLVVVFQDTTERKRSDEALRKSEELFSRFMHHLPGLAWIKDVDGKYLYANDGVEKAFGIRRRDLYGRTDDHVFPDAIAAQFKANDRSAVEQGAELQTIETLEHSDGVLHHSIVSKFPIFDVDGKTEMIGGMAIDITDRVQAEAALRESEERRMLAQEAGNVGIFDWDIKAGKTYWSETMWLIYGEDTANVNPDEAFWSDHIHDDDRERVKNNIKNVLRSAGDEFRDEYRIVMSDGSMRWIEARAAVSRDAAGDPDRMYGVNTDVTARKEAEEKLRLSDNQLRLVTNAVPALISYIDKNEYYRFANERFTDWFGLPIDKIIGRTPLDIFGPDAYSILEPNIKKALSGERCTFETVLQYKNLGDRYVQVSYIPDVGADGTVYGYYGLTHDLTDLKHSEELLRSSDERLGLMMESLTDYAIFSVDESGVINSWNKGSEIIFGYSQKEIIGRHYEILFTPEDVADAVPETEMETARRRNRASDERWLLRKDGERFFAHGVVMPLHVGQAITGCVKIVSDLTEKKRHAEELQRAHDELEMRVNVRTKELGELNAALVQEMHEREVAEKQRLDLLGRLVSSQELERRRIARDLHDSMGQRLTALRLKIASLYELGPASEEFTPRVTRLQEIAERLDSEVSFLAWELRPTTLDDLGLLDAVAAYVDEWSRHYEIAAEFHSTRLTKDRHDREIETHLYRIAQESLNNIAKHAEAKHVTVLLERRGRDLMLIVEDDGKGFDNTTRQASRESGIGLGLVGMSERAILIGGDIEIESAPGKGTTIFVRVPLQN